MPKKICRTRRKSINKLVRRSRKKPVRKSKRKSKIKGGMLKSFCNGDWCRSDNPNYIEQVVKPSKPIYLLPGEFSNLDYPVYKDIIGKLNKIRTKKRELAQRRKQTQKEEEELAKAYDDRMNPVPDPSTYDFGY